MQAENMKLLDLQTGKYLELGKYWLYGGNRIIIYAQTYIFSKDFDIVSLSEPQEPLKTLCEKTGAVVYGERYVLLSSEQDTSIHDDNHCYKNGDVVRGGYVAICTASTHYSYHQNVLDIPNFQDSCEAGFLSSKYEILGNIFEEYSKQLRNEPNKFDELKEHFK